MVGKRHTLVGAQWIRGRTRAAIAALGFLSVACAATPPAALQSLGDFVVDGATTRAGIVARLGPPAGYFSQERIAFYFLGYQLTADARGQYVRVPSVNITRPGYRGCAKEADCERQLILQYDDADLVVRHALR